MFFNKNNNDYNIFFLYERFLDSNRNFITLMWKLFEIQNSLKIFVQNSSFFSLNCQIPGFFKIPGFFATLILTYTVQIKTQKMYILIEVAKLSGKCMSVENFNLVDVKCQLKT